MGVWGRCGVLDSADVGEFDGGWDGFWDAGVGVSFDECGAACGEWGAGVWGFAADDGEREGWGDV